MRGHKTLVLGSLIAALQLVATHDASACGGCFSSPKENTQVTGHEMILSVSQQQTTLWDQIKYSGNPSSFAWVLPVRGTADIGLSSDALFGNLAELTQVTISAPPCITTTVATNAGQSAAFSPGPPAADDGVTVVSQKVVGPYETVQLSSKDPAALSSWLTMHGYAIPSDVTPVITAYVKEGFDFLALKLIPGKDVSVMRPVRVTSTGASPILPLRMVAAGTGATTSLTLWVLGEGRYEPTNLPSFEIQPSSIVWNWDTQSSNYSSLKQGGFDATGGTALLIEAGEPLSKYGLDAQITSLAASDPVGSGYADEMGKGAPEAAANDLMALFCGIPSDEVWVTRMHGELSRSALKADLTLGASPNQTQVTRSFQATNSIGKAPCPLAPNPLNSSGDSGGGVSDNSAGGGGPSVPQKIAGGGGGGCAMNADADRSSMLLGLAIAALALARKRRGGGRIEPRSGR